MKWIVLVIGLLCACSKTTTPQEGSQTHFLAMCEDDCPAPYDCVCGVCTLACEDSARCESEHPKAGCVQAAGIAAECDGTGGVCDVECKVDRDCSALGETYRCTDGRCRAAAVSGAAGSGANGTSGHGEAGKAAGSGGMSMAGAGGIGAADSGIISSAGRDGGNANDGGTTAGLCSTSQDCTLIGRACCFCEPRKEYFDAVLDRDEPTTATCAGVLCGQCPPPKYDPTPPAIRAACINNECTVVDLREQPESACTVNDDCHLVGQGCCGACGPDPRGWIALSVATVDPYRPSCEGMVMCEPCGVTLLPEAICADDGHCAVREAARVDGEPSDTCFSPWQNVATAPEATSVGCDCSESGATTCATDPDSDARLALTCSDHWSVVNDGPPCN